MKSTPQRYSDNNGSVIKVPLYSMDRDVIHSNFSIADNLSFTKSTYVTEGLSTTEDPSTTESISGGGIAGIVIAIIVLIALCTVGGYFIFRKVRERRKNHGEYRPQFEEYHHAKDLPYLQPPSIEGLI